jgi:hypothetical protein
VNLLTRDEARRIASRKTALAFEREQRPRENQRRKEEAARERECQRRNHVAANPTSGGFPFWLLHARADNFLCGRGA